MPDRNFSFFPPINMLSAQLIRPLYRQCTKKGLGTINKEKRQKIERFARIEILVRQYARLTAIIFRVHIITFSVMYTLNDRQEVSDSE